MELPLNARPRRIPQQFCSLGGHISIGRPTGAWQQYLVQNEGRRWSNAHKVLAFARDLIVPRAGDDWKFAFWEF